MGRVERACQRRMAWWFERRMFSLAAGPAIVSFTFDDFPRCALHTGGAILERAGLTGTYYVSLGWMKRTLPTGEICHPEDVHELLARGHELGCHTHDHCPAWETCSADFEASVLQNAEHLHRLAPSQTFRTHSYPISWPRPATKRRVAKYFDCCRGGGQTFNARRFDLNYVAAFFLEQSRGRPEAIREVIVRNQLAGGWLIFATHDVDSNPTRYGCTPTLFQSVVDFAVQSGAKILPVFQAWETIRRRSRQDP